METAPFLPLQQEQQNVHTHDISTGLPDCKKKGATQLSVQSDAKMLPDPMS